MPGYEERAIEAALENGRGRTTKVPKRIKKAFFLFNADRSPGRIDRIKEILDQTEIGYDALNFIEKNDISLSFGISHSPGFYSPKQNKIALNPCYSDADLALAFIHEVRHAQQNTAMNCVDLGMTADTLVKTGFISEADACVAECVLAHQRIKQGDDSLLKAMQKSPHKPISTAFEQEFLASGDLEKAKEAAMMSWYDLPEKQKYAQHYAGLIKSAARAWRKNPSNFTQRFSAKEITDRLCVDNMGKSYVSTPEMLESKEKLNVNEKTGDKIASAAYRLINAYKRSRSELGFDQIYQKDNNNQYEKLSENALMKPYAYHHNPQPYHLKMRRER